MFYHQPKNNNNSESDSDTIDIEKTARLCWLDVFSKQTLTNIHAICLLCDQLSFEPITAYLYYQPFEEKIHRQNVVFCQRCSLDYDDFQAGFIAREQYSLDLQDHEHGIPETERPRLSVGDYYNDALQDIAYVCISKLREKANIVITFEPTAVAALAEGNSNSNSRSHRHNRIIFGQTEIDMLSTSDKKKIRDVCARDEHPLDIYQICKELFDSNANARQFFYYRKQNMNIMFKPFWPLRYKIQELIGE